MAQEFVPAHGINSKYLSKEAVLRAMKMTKSGHAAARYLRVSYIHFKKYARLYKDEETGLPLLELCKNPSGKGIPKYPRDATNPGWNVPIMEIIEGRAPNWHFNPKMLKIRIIQEGLLEERCAKCGHTEKRVTDHKTPLILHHKDEVLENFLLENLEFLCYNCSFLYAKSPITDEQVDKMEDAVGRKIEEFDWEIDDYQKSYLKSLGLWEDGEKPGMEFVTRERKLTYYERKTKKKKPGVPVLKAPTLKKKR